MFGYVVSCSSYPRRIDPFGSSTDPAPHLPWSARVRCRRHVSARCTPGTGGDLDGLAVTSARDSFSPGGLSRILFSEVGDADHRPRGRRSPHSGCVVWRAYERGSAGCISSHFHCLHETARLQAISFRCITLRTTCTATRSRSGTAPCGPPELASARVAGRPRLDGSTAAPHILGAGSFPSPGPSAQTALDPTAHPDARLAVEDLSSNCPSQALSVARAGLGRGTAANRPRPWGRRYPPGVARKRSPARLVIALSIAAVLAVFLLYTSIAGGGTPSVKPSELAGRTGTVSLVGRVIGKPSGDSHAGGLRFRLRDVEDPAGATVAVVYTGQRARPLRDRARPRRRRSHAKRDLHRRPRLHGHQVPVEVHGQAGR